MRTDQHLCAQTTSKPGRGPLVVRLGRVGALAVCSLLVASACSSEQSTVVDDGRTQVVVTTGIWADVVNTIACSDDIAVHSLIPDNADPHGYEPTFKDQELLDRADLVIENGRHLEHGWSDGLDQARSSGTPIITIANEVPTVPGVSANDPHIWFDPTLVVESLQPLGEALSLASGVAVAEIQPCIDAYSTELLKLDHDIEGMVSGLPDDRRVMITNHDSFAYFGARYDIEIADSILPSGTLSEANPADLEALEQEIAERNVPVVFAEYQHSGAEAEAIAERLGAGVDVVYLYTGSLGEPGSGADTYLSMLLFDATTIVEALDE